jgi:F-type H+-transporting ATPase subunit b
MVVIFGIVFFLLAKFGFPIITSMVDKRNATIKKSLDDAREIESRLAGIMAEHAQMLEDARKEQTAILRDAADTRSKMIADAKEQARAEADKILTDARAEIAAEKEAAIRDVRREVALLSVSIAEKILRKELADEGAQREYIDRMVEETVREEIHS